MMTAMLLKLLNIFVSAVKAAFGDFLRHCMVCLAAYPFIFRAEFAISPAKLLFGGVKICR